MNILIRKLKQSDFDSWSDLWEQYLNYYKTQLSEEIYTTTFSRLINPDMIKTNIIYFSLDHSKISSELLLDKMLKKNIHFFELGPSWFRLVTHAGISKSDINFVVGEFNRILS